MLLTAAAVLFGTAAAQVSPPRAVKQRPQCNQLYLRHKTNMSRENIPALMQAPNARYVSVAGETAAPTGMQLPEIIGGMLDSQSWESTVASAGLYRFPASEGAPFEFVRSGIYPNGGGVEADGMYYSCEVEESSDGVSIIIRAYDTETWRNTRSFSPGDYSFIATDVAYDPLTGQIFGCLWDTSGSGYMFGTIDYINGVTHKIKALDNMWNAVAIDADGTIYAIDQVMAETGAEVNCVKSSLYKVDRATGALTLVGDTGLLPYYASSAVIDRRTGRMFWSVTPKDDTQSALYEVDKATGACTLVYRYPGAEQFMGMYIPAAAAEDNAPAAAADLAAAFDKGSLSGTVSFTVPAKTFAGEEGSGDIYYEIFANGVEAASGATAWGKKENVGVNLPAGGEVEFTVVLVNAAGPSPKVKTKVFAGTDVPVSPEVTASWNDGVMTVQWTRPQTSVNGGYIDPSALRFKVTRFPDNVVVAGETPGLSFSEPVAEPENATTYYYSVEAVYDRKSSAPGVSNRIVLGAESAPWSLDFGEVDNTDGITLINCDPDSKAWTLSGNALLLREDKVMPKDDWMITAPVRLLPGHVYAVNVRVSSQGANYPEYIEIFSGKDNTVEGMTDRVLDRTKIATAFGSDCTVTGYIVPEGETTVFVGIHACSPADAYNLRVYSVSIEPAFATTAPGAVTGFTVTPDAGGAQSAAVACTMPAVDYDGNTITSLTKLEILCDGIVVHEVESPVPGAEMPLWTDSEVATGIHTYSAIAYNESGRGRESRVQVFVGVDKPLAPATADISETENPGEVTITWAPVTTGASGYPLNPELVSYNVYEPNETGSAWVIAASGVKDTSITLRATEGKQIFTFYAVAAVTDGGLSDGCVTEFIPVGNPFALPYDESFPNGTISTLFTYTGTSGDWEVSVNSPEYLAQADDNGFAQMIGEYYGSNADLISGKIDLSGAVNPVLKFSTFNYYTSETGPDYNTIEVYVRTLAGEWNKANETIVKDAAEQNRWGSVTVDLNAYTGKVIQLIFRATNYSYDRTTLDRIRVDNGVDHNLTLVSLAAPSQAEANKEFDINVKVENNGNLDASEFTVSLFRDDVQLASRTVGGLASGRSLDIAFTDVFTPLVTDNVYYHAVVAYGKDMVASDNISEKAAVAPVVNTLPVVTNLQGRIAADVPVLEWDEPDTDSAAPEPVTESFEDATPYAVDGGCGFTVFDADGAASQTGTIGTTESEPGVNDGSPLAWAVLDHNSGFAARYTTFEGHTGAKSMLAIAASGKANDDWLISPRLYGGAQDVSFFVRTFSDDPVWGTETLGLYYSATGTDVADFTVIDELNICNDEWTKHSFALPDGAVYFAIRYISDDCYGVMVDDFEFIPEGLSADLSLLGYNIYRDGEKINGQPVEDTNYTDESAPAGSHTYVVTAIYDKGESAPSESVTLMSTGIAGIDADGVNVTAEGRSILVSGADGMFVSLSGADGRVLSTCLASGIVRFDAVVAGIYIVKAGDKVCKIAIR